MDQTKILTTVEEIRVFSDPYRLEIFSTLHQFKRPATVKQIADKMNEVPAKVHYHVKKMEKVGLVKLAYTEEINGIVAKFYEPTASYITIEKNQIPPEWLDEIMKEGAKAYATLYDRSKEIFIKNTGAISSGMISSGEIYLTKEDALEIQTHIQELLKKYEQPHSDDCELYHLFASLVQFHEKDKASPDSEK